MNFSDKNKSIPIVVNPVIIPDEVIIRGMLHYFHIKKRKKIKREAFLPPPESNEVSTLRYNYTTLSFCKKHTKVIAQGFKPHVYFGIAWFIAGEIAGVNNDIENGTIDLIPTPLDESKNIREFEPEVKSTDSGLPMHSDIIYSEYSPPRGAEPNTKLRKIADKVAKIARLLIDKHQDEEEWVDEL